MFGNLKLAAVGALSLGLVVGAAGIARTDNAPHTNSITFSRGVALPGVELAAGTYIFETPTNSMANSIVRVSSQMAQGLPDGVHSSGGAPEERQG